jgi:arsenate reductase
MAEAYLRQMGGDAVDVMSAGLQPSDEIHELTVAVMNEVGLTLEGQHPSHITDYLGKVPVTTVITVCDRAESDCPTTWPGAVERLHWPFDDPASYQTDDPAAQIEKFREVREAIREKVAHWLSQTSS